MRPFHFRWMVYLLLLVIVYSVLAAVVYDRRPQALTNRILSLYIVTILGMTIGALAVETAAGLGQAKAGACFNLAALTAANTVVASRDGITWETRHEVWQDPIFFTIRLTSIAASAAAQATGLPP